jgi:hypothetical protein
LSKSLGGEPDGLLDAARWMVRARRSRASHLQRLRDALPDVPLFYVPYLFLRSYGMRATRQVAAALGQELES